MSKDFNRKCSPGWCGGVRCGDFRNKSTGGKKYDQMLVDLQSNLWYQGSPSYLVIDGDGVKLLVWL
jgi:hypothetical protein